MVMGALVGWALGLGIDRLSGRGKVAQTVGIFVGLAGGAWGAWRELKIALSRRGDNGDE